jgi:SPX domain protein involved in polyphosphate accumulation
MPADDNSRIELKYRLNYFHYLKIRNAIIPYVKKDSFTLRSQGKGYLVRSLYFDTYDYKAYHEKMSGDSDRIKFRLRSYSQELDEHTVIKAELKVRKANVVEKHTTVISADYYKYFMRHHCWPENDNPILSEFERYVHLKELSPKVLIEYEREGYASRTKDDVRITFDHKVRSAQATNLFPGHLFYKVHHPHGVVLEIKFHDELPLWLTLLAQSHGLKVIANSKFTQGIQVARNDLHHPDGVVVVR